jgi:serine/threonine protein kinase
LRPERWSRVKELFEAALEKPPAERSAWLDGLSGIDPEVREEVERRLRMGDSSRGPADTGPTLVRPRGESGGAERPPRRVGPYRLIEEIGRGGMGTVHLAVRDDDEYKKRVAIKLLKKGMDSEEVVRRFRNERQILAAVEHAHIAKLYDGATTDEGNPYFVMELVQGQPLDQYCDTHRLTIPERLELFRKVCAAVQVAHQNLVVHRDLKPGNILVTAEGEPKLLDFGIAKLLNPELASATMDPTRFQVGLMTPAYASPEPAARSDVAPALGGLPASGAPAVRRGWGSRRRASPRRSRQRAEGGRRRSWARRADRRVHGRGLAPLIRWLESRRAATGPG